MTHPSRKLAPLDSPNKPRVPTRGARRPQASSWGPGAGSRRGRSARVAGTRCIRGPTTPAARFRVNGNKVLVRQRFTGRGAGSGMELDLTVFVVFTVEDDLVTRAEG